MRIKLLSIVAVSAAAISTAIAHEVAPAKPFTMERFQSLQESGRPFVVQVHADACENCETQTRALKAIKHHPKFDQLGVLRLDRDQQLDQATGLDIQKPGTIAFFAGDKELGRTTSANKPRPIVRFLRKTLRKHADCD